MWKDIVRLFRSESALESAYDEAILMLRASHSMFDDSVAALHAEGTPEVDIYKRDRTLNKYERRGRAVKIQPLGSPELPHRQALKPRPAEPPHNPFR